MIVRKGAWDCHAHVIEDSTRFPLSPGRTYDPPAAPLQEYLSMLDRHDLARGVLVQPSVYSHDNSCMLDALDRAGGRLLGVAVPDPASTFNDLREMHRRGVRGVRCNLLSPGGITPKDVIPWQPLMRELGWHVSFHVHIDQVPDMRRFVGQFEVPVVIDHMGRPRGDRPLTQIPQSIDLIELVRDGKCYVKVSAPYRLSAGTAPWQDVAALARALINANPARCLWATDWPHTDTPSAIAEEDLIAALNAWCPDARARAKILSEVPPALHAN